MTDKVQKIKEWIQTRKLCTMDEHMKFYCKEAESDYNLLCSIEKILDSLQEESVSEDFETALEKKVREAQDWTYIEEEGGECPLNEEFGADDLEEFARWGADWVRNNKKEPISEDLEEAAEDFCEGEWDGLHDNGGNPLYTQDYLEYTFKAGANWREEQLMAKAVDGDITFDYYGDDDKTYGCIAHNSFCLEDLGLEDTDKVKMIVIKKG